MLCRKGLAAYLQDAQVLVVMMNGGRWRELSENPPSFESIRISDSAYHGRIANTDYSNTPVVEFDRNMIEDAVSSNNLKLVNCIRLVLHVTRVSRFVLGNEFASESISTACYPLWRWGCEWIATHDVSKVPSD